MMVELLSQAGKMTALLSTVTNTPSEKNCQPNASIGVRLFPPAYSSEPPAGQKNGEDAHEEEVEAISPECRDRAGISLLVDPAEGLRLTRREEEAAVLIAPRIFTSGLHAFANSD